MNRPLAIAAALGATVLLTAGSCQQADPCDSLRRPTAEQQKVAEDPRVEVERPVGDTDCVVVDDQWVNEADLETEDDDH